jgi:DNA-binding MarR family transcriptional regulator
MMKFSFEQSYGRILGMTSTNLFRHLGKLMAQNELPITPEQFSLLSHLWAQDGRSQQELACLTARDRANVTRLIDILEREDIVKRCDDPNDRRVFKIFLTEKGKNIEQKMAAVAQQTIKEATEGITEEEMAICMKVLKQTIENLK